MPMNESRWGLMLFRLLSRVSFRETVQRLSFIVFLCGTYVPQSRGDVNWAVKGVRTEGPTRRCASSISIVFNDCSTMAVIADDSHRTGWVVALFFVGSCSRLTPPNGDCLERPSAPCWLPYSFGVVSLRLFFRSQELPRRRRGCRRRG